MESGFNERRNESEDLKESQGEGVWVVLLERGKREEWERGEERTRK